MPRPHALSIIYIPDTNVSEAVTEQRRTYADIRERRIVINATLCGLDTSAGRYRVTGSCHELDEDKSAIMNTYAALDGLSGPTSTASPLPVGKRISQRAMTPWAMHTYFRLFAFLTAGCSAISAVAPRFVLEQNK